METLEKIAKAAIPLILATGITYFVAPSLMEKYDSFKQDKYISELREKGM